ncbi:MAG: hypothetical protein Q4B48_05365 [Syntrophomonadaceae bacterium]|nr:hypothetical protein [Syntrophomonadaceae bacterium]
MNQQQKMYLVLGVCFIPVGITYWLICHFLMPEVNMPSALFIVAGGLIVALIGFIAKRDKNGGI